MEHEFSTNFSLLTCWQLGMHIAAWKQTDARPVHYKHASQCNSGLHNNTSLAVQAKLCLNQTSKHSIGLPKQESTVLQGDTHTDPYIQQYICRIKDRTQKGCLDGKMSLSLHHPFHL